jgi:hypothetical protein
MYHGNWEHSGQSKRCRNINLDLNLIIIQCRLCENPLLSLLFFKFFYNNRILFLIVRLYFLNKLSSLKNYFVPIIAYKAPNGIFVINFSLNRNFRKKFG